MTESPFGGTPPAAYNKTLLGKSALRLNAQLYTAISQSITPTSLIHEFTIPIRSARAWEVKAGQVCRIVAIDGPQVGDFNVWNAQNPRERMWASRTRQLEKAHLTRHDRIWSTLPYLRPLLTFTADSLEAYGRDAEGGRVHDLLGTRCDPYVNHLLTGRSFDFSCHSNLTRAVLPYGLTELDVHDVLNVFQCTGLNEEDEYFMKASPAKKGDFLEFFAEMDILCALSTCPSGDQSLPLWGRDTTEEELVKTCRPLGIQIYEVEDALLAEWSPPQRPQYKNNHGLQFPAWE